MPKHTLTERVEVLEQKVEGLDTLPARVEAVELQIVQLRTEMRSGFSDVRQEMAAMAAGLREEIRKSEEGLRTELIMEIRKGGEDTRRYMRMLHEEVISKIATIEEGRRPRRKK